jgi:hypothetical protein
MAERIEEDPGNFPYPSTPLNGENAALHCVSLRWATRDQETAREEILVR